MNASPMPAPTQQGWSARLNLAFAARHTATILAVNRHSGPLRLQRPLYPEGTGVCHACILHPPGGVVGGDRLTVEVTVGDGANALVTTPGATKFYRSNGARASQRQRFTVADDASLEWFPQDNIFYPGTEAVTETRIELAAGARFIGWEVQCLGLPAAGAEFRAGRLSAGLKLFRSGRPLLLDRLEVSPNYGLHRPTGLRGQPVTAVFLATGADREMLAPLRALLPAPSARLTAAVTLMDDLLVARCIGESTFEARGWFQDLWSWLRPHLLGRRACPPRIWST
jgi:urease accessory protein